MSADHTNLMVMVVFPFLSGFFSAGQKVDYPQTYICVVRGSSVVIPCSYYYPAGGTPTDVMWGQEMNIYDGPFIFDSRTTNSSRFHYIGDKTHNCSLKINQVEHNDAARYAFRFETSSGVKWTGAEGSMLKVADLNISVTKPPGNGATTEGGSMNLTCMNPCDDGKLSSAFTWFKNGEPITEGAVLPLINMSSTNSGNYSCSLKAQTGTMSLKVINVDVEYGPKNVSVRPAMDANSSITLICSSHANPPVQDYTWFKLDDGDIMAVGDQPVFSSADAGQYLCRATNKHGSQNSSVVILKGEEVRLFQSTANRNAAIFLTVAALLIVIITVVLSRLKKRRRRAPESSCEEDTQNSIYINLPVFGQSQSQEGPQPQGATEELVYAKIHSKSGKSSMEQQANPHDDGGVIYSTVCRKQSLTSSENRDRRTNR